MALSIVKRPIGFSNTTINFSNSFTATYTDNSSIITGVNFIADGQSIYISTGQAIGFYYFTNITPFNTFNIREFATASPFVFVGSGTLSYTIVNRAVRFNSAHLPIVYKLKSTLWPTNSVDTVRTVSSYSNDNGYAKITASGSIKSDITELEFVKVTFTGGTSAIYQVITWFSNSVVTINLPFVGGITFVSIQYYYNNYHARIRVYAGLDGSEHFGYVKPFELITEQEVIPDSTGIVELNINEFLKQKIEILKNDLNKGTLPNNLDAFCQFYISFAEAYDYSTGGYTLLDFIGSYTDDTVDPDSELYAINAQMPFKNIHSGYLSEYVYDSFGNNTFKFLTPSTHLTLFPNNYFDLSWINQFGEQLRVKFERYVNGSIINSAFTAVSDFGIGVYRTSVTKSSTFNEDRIDVSIWNTTTKLSETKTITINNDCSPNHIYMTWENNLGGYEYYDFKSNSDIGVTIEETKTVKKNVYSQWPKSFGITAESIDQETVRTSRQNITLRAENLVEDQISDLFRIRTSPLVQMFTGTGNEKKTVIVDRGSFVYLQQGEKLFNLSFNISMTDNLPVQSL